MAVTQTTHKVQKTHDLVVPYQTLREWVHVYTGVHLPVDPTNMTLEIDTERLALAWSDEWAVERTQPVAWAGDRGGDK